VTGLPTRRFVVLSKRPGHVPTTCTPLLTEEGAEDALNRLLGDVRVRSVQYAVAELQLTRETYR
jgi:hypothetical protein